MRYPYIGITDFMAPNQVSAMLSVLNLHKSTTLKHKLHVGVMMSYKTLHNIETKWAKAFPQNKEIEQIFYSDETYNCLHFADYDNMPELRDSLAKAIHYAGKKLHCIQLDMIWPDPDHIRFALNAFPARNIEIILQVGKHAMAEAGNDPSIVVERLKSYEGIVQRVLLDKSMGKGLGMDARELAVYARAIKCALPNLCIGAAGGLGPETMDLALPLISEFPDISIDAQSKLRPSGNALDPIDWNMASEYLKKAISLFC